MSEVGENGSGSIALGENSFVNEALAVSIGNDDLKRKIINVKKGNISEASTDAVNGSQLYAIESLVNNLQTNINNLENSALNPDDVSDVMSNVISNNFKAGNNITIDESTNPDDGSKTFTINAVQPNIEAGTGVTIDKDGDKITINANSTTVSSGGGITVTTTTSTLDNGATNTNYEVALSDNLKAKIAKEESVSAGSPNVIVKQEGVSDTGGKNFVVDITKNVQVAANAQSIAKNTQDIAKLNDRINNLDNKVDKINKRLKAGIASSNTMAGLPHFKAAHTGSPFGFYY